MITFTDDELDDIFELVKKEYEKVKTEHMSVEPFHITPESDKIRDAASETLKTVTINVPESHRGEVTSWLHDAGYDVRIPNPNEDHGFGSIFKYKNIIVSWK
jgi:hypothetical protein